MRKNAMPNLPKNATNAGPETGPVEPSIFATMVANYRETPPATNGRKPVGETGKGNPNARKIINPQPTINLKNWVVRSNGGIMKYSNRIWTMEFPGPDGTTRTVECNSKTMAGMDLNAWAGFLGITVPTGKPNPTKPGI